MTKSSVAPRFVYCPKLIPILSGGRRPLEAEALCAASSCVVQVVRVTESSIDLGLAFNGAAGRHHGLMSLPAFQIRVVRLHRQLDDITTDQDAGQASEGGVVHADERIGFASEEPAAAQEEGAAPTVGNSVGMMSSPSVTLLRHRVLRLNPGTVYELTVSVFAELNGIGLRGLGSARVHVLTLDTVDIHRLCHVGSDFVSFNVVRRDRAVTCDAASRRLGTETALVDDNDGECRSLVLLTDRPPPLLSVEAEIVKLQHYLPDTASSSHTATASTTSLPAPTVGASAGNGDQSAAATLVTDYARKVTLHRRSLQLQGHEFIVSLAGLKEACLYQVRVRGGVDDQSPDDRSTDRLVAVPTSAVVVHGARPKGAYGLWCPPCIVSTLQPERLTLTHRSAASLHVRVARLQGADEAVSLRKRALLPSRSNHGGIRQRRIHLVATWEDNATKMEALREELADVSHALEQTIDTTTTTASRPRLGSSSQHSNADGSTTGWTADTIRDVDLVSSFSQSQLDTSDGQDDDEDDDDDDDGDAEGGNLADGESGKSEDNSHPALAAAQRGGGELRKKQRERRRSNVRAILEYFATKQTVLSSRLRQPHFIDKYFPITIAEGGDGVTAHLDGLDGDTVCQLTLECQKEVDEEDDDDATSAATSTVRQIGDSVAADRRDDPSDAKFVVLVDEVDKAASQPPRDWIETASLTVTTGRSDASTTDGDEANLASSRLAGSNGEAQLTPTQLCEALSENQAAHLCVDTVTETSVTMSWKAVDDAVIDAVSKALDAAEAGSLRRQELAERLEALLHRQKLCGMLLEQGMVLEYAARVVEFAEDDDEEMSDHRSRAARGPVDSEKQSDHHRVVSLETLLPLGASSVVSFASAHSSDRGGPSGPQRRRRRATVLVAPPMPLERTASQTSSHKVRQGDELGSGGSRLKTRRRTRLVSVVAGAPNLATPSLLAPYEDAPSPSTGHLKKRKSVAVSSLLIDDDGSSTADCQFVRIRSALTQAAMAPAVGESSSASELSGGPSSEPFLTSSKIASVRLSSRGASHRDDGAGPTVRQFATVVACYLRGDATRQQVMRADSVRRRSCAQDVGATGEDHEAGAAESHPQRAARLRASIASPDFGLLERSIAIIDSRDCDPLSCGIEGDAAVEEHSSSTPHPSVTSVDPGATTTLGGDGRDNVGRTTGSAAQRSPSSSSLLLPPITFQTRRRTHTFEGLRPNTVYSVQLSMFNPVTGEWLPPSPAVTFATLPYAAIAAVIIPPPATLQCNALYVTLLEPEVLRAERCLAVRGMDSGSTSPQPALTPLKAHHRQAQLPAVSALNSSVGSAALRSSVSSTPSSSAAAAAMPSPGRHVTLPNHKLSFTTQLYVEVTVETVKQPGTARDARTGDGQSFVSPWGRDEEGAALAGSRGGGGDVVGDLDASFGWVTKAGSQVALRNGVVLPAHRPTSAGCDDNDGGLTTTVLPSEGGAPTEGSDAPPRRFTVPAWTLLPGHRPTTDANRTGSPAPTHSSTLGNRRPPPSTSLNVAPRSTTAPDRHPPSLSSALLATRQLKAEDSKWGGGGGLAIGQLAHNTAYVIRLRFVVAEASSYEVFAPPALRESVDLPSHRTSLSPAKQPQKADPSSLSEADRMWLPPSVLSSAIRHRGPWCPPRYVAFCCVPVDVLHLDKVAVTALVEPPARIAVDVPAMSASFLQSHRQEAPDDVVSRIFARLLDDHDDDQEQRGGELSADASPSSKTATCNSADAATVSPHRKPSGLVRPTAALQGDGSESDMNDASSASACHSDRLANQEEGDGDEGGPCVQLYSYITVGSQEPQRTKIVALPHQLSVNLGDDERVMFMAVAAVDFGSIEDDYAAWCVSRCGWSEKFVLLAASRYCVALPLEVKDTTLELGFTLHKVHDNDNDIDLDPIRWRRGGHHRPQQGRSSVPHFDDSGKGHVDGGQPNGAPSSSPRSRSAGRSRSVLQPTRPRSVDVAPPAADSNNPSHAVSGDRQYVQALRHCEDVMSRHNLQGIVVEIEVDDLGADGQHDHQVADHQASRGTRPPASKDRAPSASVVGPMIRTCLHRLASSHCVIPGLLPSHVYAIRSRHVLFSTTRAASRASSSSAGSSNRRGSTAAPSLDNSQFGAATNNVVSSVVHSASSVAFLNDSGAGTGGKAATVPMSRQAVAAAGVKRNVYGLWCRRAIIRTAPPLTVAVISANEDAAVVEWQRRPEEAALRVGAATGGLPPSSVLLRPFESGTVTGAAAEGVSLVPPLPVGRDFTRQALGTLEGDGALLLYKSIALGTVSITVESYATSDESYAAMLREAQSSWAQSRHFFQDESEGGGGGGTSAAHSVLLPSGSVLAHGASFAQVASAPRRAVLTRDRLREHRVCFDQLDPNTPYLVKARQEDFMSFGGGEPMTGVNPDDIVDWDPSENGVPPPTATVDAVPEHHHPAHNKHGTLTRSNSGSSSSSSELPHSSRTMTQSKLTLVGGWSANAIGFITLDPVTLHVSMGSEDQCTMHFLRKHPKAFDWPRVTREGAILQPFPDLPAAPSQRALSPLEPRRPRGNGNGGSAAGNIIPAAATTTPRSGRPQGLSSASSAREDGPPPTSGGVGGRQQEVEEQQQLGGEGNLYLLQIRLAATPLMSSAAGGFFPPSSANDEMDRFIANAMKKPPRDDDQDGIAASRRSGTGSHPRSVDDAVATFYRLTQPPEAANRSGNRPASAQRDPRIVKPVAVNSAVPSVSTTSGGGGVTLSLHRLTVPPMFVAPDAALHGSLPDSSSSSSSLAWVAACTTVCMAQYVDGDTYWQQFQLRNNAASKNSASSRGAAIPAASSAASWAASLSQPWFDRDAATMTSTEAVPLHSRRANISLIEPLSDGSLLISVRPNVEHRDIGGERGYAGSSSLSSFLCVGLKGGTRYAAQIRCLATPLSSVPSRWSPWVEFTTKAAPTVEVESIAERGVDLVLLVVDEETSGGGVVDGSRRRDGKEEEEGRATPRAAEEEGYELEVIGYHLRSGAVGVDFRDDGVGRAHAFSVRQFKLPIRQRRCRLEGLLGGTIYGACVRWHGRDRHGPSSPLVFFRTLPPLTCALRRLGETYAVVEASRPIPVAGVEGAADGSRWMALAHRLATRVMAPLSAMEPSARAKVALRATAAIGSVVSILRRQYDPAQEQLEFVVLIGGGGGLTTSLGAGSLPTARGLGGSSSAMAMSGGGAESGDDGVFSQRHPSAIVESFGPYLVVRDLPPGKPFDVRVRARRARYVLGESAGAATMAGSLSTGGQHQHSAKGTGLGPAKPPSGSSNPMEKALRLLASKGGSGADVAPPADAASWWCTPASFVTLPKTTIPTAAVDRDQCVLRVLRPPLQSSNTAATRAPEVVTAADDEVFQVSLTGLLPLMDAEVQLAVAKDGSTHSASTTSSSCLDPPSSPRGASVVASDAVDDETRRQADERDARVKADRLSVIRRDVETAPGPLKCHLVVPRSTPLARGAPQRQSPRGALGPSTATISITGLRASCEYRVTFRSLIDVAFVPTKWMREADKARITTSERWMMARVFRTGPHAPTLPGLYEWRDRHATILWSMNRGASMAELTTLSDVQQILASPAPEGEATVAPAFVTSAVNYQAVSQAERFAGGGGEGERSLGQRTTTSALFRLTQEVMPWGHMRAVFLSAGQPQASSPSAKAASTSDGADVPSVSRRDETGGRPIAHALACPLSMLHEPFRHDRLTFQVSVARVTIVPDDRMENIEEHQRGNTQSAASSSSRIATDPKPKTSPVSTGGDLVLPAAPPAARVAQRDGSTSEATTKSLLLARRSPPSVTIATADPNHRAPQTPEMPALRSASPSTSRRPSVHAAFAATPRMALSDFVTVAEVPHTCCRMFFPSSTEPHWRGDTLLVGGGGGRSPPTRDASVAKDGITVDAKTILDGHLSGRCFTGRHRTGAGRTGGKMGARAHSPSRLWAADAAIADQLAFRIRAVTHQEGSVDHHNARSSMDAAGPSSGTAAYGEWSCPVVFRLPAQPGAPKALTLQVSTPHSGSQRNVGGGGAVTLIPQRPVSVPLGSRRPAGGAAGSSSRDVDSAVAGGFLSTATVDLRWQPPNDASLHNQLHYVVELQRQDVTGAWKAVQLVAFRHSPRGCEKGGSWTVDCPASQCSSAPTPASDGDDALAAATEPQNIKSASAGPLPPRKPVWRTFGCDCMMHTVVSDLPSASAFKVRLRALSTFGMSDPSTVVAFATPAAANVPLPLSVGQHSLVDEESQRGGRRRRGSDAAPFADHTGRGGLSSSWRGWMPSYHATAAMDDDLRALQSWGVGEAVSDSRGSVNNNRPSHQPGSIVAVVAAGSRDAARVAPQKIASQLRPAVRDAPAYFVQSDGRFSIPMWAKGRPSQVGDQQAHDGASLKGLTEAVFPCDPACDALTTMSSWDGSTEAMRRNTAALHSRGDDAKGAAAAAGGDESIRAAVKADIANNVSEAPTIGGTETESPQSFRLPYHDHSSVAPIASPVDLDGMFQNHHKGRPSVASGDPVDAPYWQLHPLCSWT